MRKLVALGLAATLAGGAAAPASAAPWDGVGTQCATVGGLNICMDFELTQTGGSGILADPYTYQLSVDYTGGWTGSMLAAFGLFDANGDGIPSATSVAVVGTSDGTWQIGAGGLTGNPLYFTLAENSTTGNNGAFVPGHVAVTFSSTYGEGAFTELAARAHIQKVGLPAVSCSVQWGSDAPGYLLSTGTNCPGGGTDNTVPEPVSLILLGSGLLGIGSLRIRRRK